MINEYDLNDMGYKLIFVLINNIKYVINVIEMLVLVLMYDIFYIRIK